MVIGMTVAGTATAMLLRKAFSKPSASSAVAVVLERPLARAATGGRAPSTSRCVSTRSSGAERRDRARRRSGSARAATTTRIVMRTNQPPLRGPTPSLPTARRRRRLVGLGRHAARCSAHRIASCSRNWRTFQTITGMMARNSTTAMAAPRPSWLLMKNQSDHALGDDLGAVGLGVAHDEDDVEHLQGVDDHVGGHDDDRRQDARDHDPAEHLELGGAVDAGGLDDLVGDRLDGRRQHDHGEPGLHPDHDHHEQEVVPRLLLAATAPGPARARS